jgi:hypothetical protein
MPAPARIAVFAFVSAGLIALAVVLAPAGPAPAPAPPQAAKATVAVPGAELIATAERRKARLDRAATAFIGVFLRYEVGDLPPPVVRSLSRLSTASFGRYLLDARPRQLGARGVARIVKVETAFLAPTADRALVRGVARRTDGPEELSFVFILHGGRWLAARAAE